MALTKLSSLRKNVDRVTDVAEESYTLPARYFFDPEIYERERELIFFKNWWFAGHVSELPRPRKLFHLPDFRSEHTSYPRQWTT